MDTLAVVKIRIFTKVYPNMNKMAMTDMPAGTDFLMVSVAEY